MKEVPVPWSHNMQAFQLRGIYRKATGHDKRECRWSAAISTTIKSPHVIGWKSLCHGILFCCDGVIKEIYFYTKLPLSPSLKCKCNHVTSLLRILQGLPSFTAALFSSSSTTRSTSQTKYKPLSKAC